MQSDRPFNDVLFKARSCYASKCRTHQYFRSIRLPYYFIYEPSLYFVSDCKGVPVATRRESPPTVLMRAAARVSIHSLFPCFLFFLFISLALYAPSSVLWCLWHQGSIFLFFEAFLNSPRGCKFPCFFLHSIQPPNTWNTANEFASHKLQITLIRSF